MTVTSLVTTSAAKRHRRGGICRGDARLQFFGATGCRATIYARLWRRVVRMTLLVVAKMAGMTEIQHGRCAHIPWQILFLMHHPLQVLFFCLLLFLCLTVPSAASGLEGGSCVLQCALNLRGGITSPQPGKEHPSAKLDRAPAQGGVVETPTDAVVPDSTVGLLKALGSEGANGTVTPAGEVLPQQRRRRQANENQRVAGSPTRPVAALRLGARKGSIRALKRGFGFIRLDAFDGEPSPTDVFFDFAEQVWLFSLCCCPPGRPTAASPRCGCCLAPMRRPANSECICACCRLGRTGRSPHQGGAPRRQGCLRSLHRCLSQSSR